MSAAMINDWIKSLGRTYDDLVSNAIIPNQSLNPLFSAIENNEFIQYPIAGAELWFLDNNRRFEKIILTLIQTDEGEPVYNGSLPFPFELKMTQSCVRSRFGTPIKSLGAAKIPGSNGKEMGGWEAYRLHERYHPHARVGFSYTSDLLVKTLAFALIDVTRTDI